MPLFFTADEKWIYQDDIIITELRQKDLIDRMHALTLLTDGRFKFDNVRAIKARDFLALQKQASIDLKRIDNESEKKDK